MKTAGTLLHLVAFALLVVLIPRNSAVPDLLFKDTQGSSNVNKFGDEILSKTGTGYASNDLIKELKEGPQNVQSVLGKFSYFGNSFDNVTVCSSINLFVNHLNLEKLSIPVSAFRFYSKISMALLMMVFYQKIFSYF